MPGLARDAFLRGTHSPLFATSFGAGAHLDWTLLPPFGPLTRLRADERPPRCEQSSRMACIRGCDAMAAAIRDPPTTAPSWSMEDCVASCVDANEWVAACVAESDAWYECIGRLDPKDPANWLCDDAGGVTFVSDVMCGAEAMAYCACANDL